MSLTEVVSHITAVGDDDAVLEGDDRGVGRGHFRVPDKRPIGVAVQGHEPPTGTGATTRMKPLHGLL